MADSLKVRIDGDDSGFRKTLSGIEGVAKKGFSAVSKGVAATSAGVAALTTLAVKSYGQYEQLVGGIDTLFESSSKKVQENAAKAYKSAGVSANQYMETATSFAASLKQSFDDTAEGISKAADVADMAITDMADNSNKMGTAMESIQWAYQGFAKQNYTMLDNLKLGYGGTKQEMERLLADAEKLSGVKYDISNLADVYTAIHVIQEELGITGTTAKEASTTIVGSANMMKASWSNMMTGIADDNADMDRLMDELIDSVLTFADNIMPRVETAVEGIGEFASKAADRLIPELIDVFLSAAPELAEAAVDMISALVEGISDNADEIASAAVEIGEELVEGIVEIIPQVVAAAGEIISAFASEIGKAIPILRPFTSVISMLGDNIGTLTPLIISAVAAMKGFSIAESIIGTVTRLASSYQTAALQVGLYTLQLGINTTQQGISKIITVEETAALTAKEIIVGALTKKIPLVTAAQALWNATVAAHPIGAIIVAITLLIGVIGTLCVAFDKETEAEKRHREAVEENISAVKQSKKAIEEQADAMRKSVASTENETVRTKALADELLSLADASGMVAEADRGRAQFILGELNSALGTEYSMVDGVIQKYGELQSEIYNLIEAKRANALAEVVNEQYATAVKEQTTVTKNLTDAREAAAPQLAEYARLQSEVTRLQKEYNESMAKYGHVNGELEISLGEARDAVRDYRNEYSELLQNAWEAEDVFYANANTMEMCGAAMTALANGDINGFIAKVTEMNTAIANGSIELSNFATNSQTAIENAGDAVHDKFNGLLETLKAGNAATAETMLHELRNLVENYIAAGGEIHDGFITSLDMDGMATEVDLNPLLDALAKYYPEIKEVGLEFFRNFADGIEEGEPEAEKSAENVADATVSGLETGIAPAGAAGDKTINAFTSKIASGSGAGAAAGTQVVNATVSAVESGVPLFAPLGSQAVVNFSDSLLGGTGAATAAATGVVQSAVSGASAKNSEWSTEGKEALNSYATGLKDTAGLAAVNTAGGGMASEGATGAAAGAGAFKDAGVDAVDGFIAGLSDPGKLSEVYNAAYNVAQEGERGLADGQNSNSPAKDYIDLAGDAIDGLVLGVDKNKEDYKDAMYEAAKEGEEAYAKGLEDAERASNFSGGYTGEDLKAYWEKQGLTPSELRQRESANWQSAQRVLGRWAEMFFEDGWDYGAFAKVVGAENLTKFLSNIKFTPTYGPKNEAGENPLWGAMLEAYKDGELVFRRVKDDLTKFGYYKSDGDLMLSAEEASEAISSTAKDTAKDVYKTQVVASEESKKAEAEWMADVLGIQSEATDNMLDSEKKYFDEKAKIETQRHYAEYLEKVNNAESIEEIEEIKQDYINEKAREGEDRYLEGLRETAEKEKEIYENTAEEIEAIFKKRNDIVERLRDETPDTFQTVTIQDGENEYSYTKLADVGVDNEKLAEYEESLQKLFERAPDLPDSIKKELQGMGLEEGMNYVSALLRASDKELEEFISEREKQEKRSGNIADMLMTDEMEGFRNKLTEQFGEIPDGFFDVGENSALEFGEGFFNQVKKVIESGKGSISELLMGLFNPAAFFSELAAVGGVETNSRINNYYLLPSDTSLASQMEATRRADTYDRMKGE